MKKFIIALLAATTVFAFSSCGSECDICGEGGANNDYEGQTLCDDCYAGFEALEALSDLEF